MQASQPATAAEMGYFADVPWGKVPEDRKGDLVLEGPQLRGGLLGGSSGQKSSKLAALAKKRKEKAQAATTAREEKTSISLLSRLSQKQPFPIKDAPEASSLSPSSTSPSQLPSPPPPPLQPLTPREVTPAPLTPSQTVRKEQSIVDLDQPKKEYSVVPEAVATEQVVKQEPLGALPSSFAKSIFGERITLRHEIDVADACLFFVSGNKETGKPNPFAGPSPDDIVVTAQSASKGEELNRSKEVQGRKF
jgi:elongation factor 1 alpha-like protein